VSYRLINGFSEVAPICSAYAYATLGSSETGMKPAVSSSENPSIINSEGSFRLRLWCLSVATLLAYRCAQCPPQRPLYCSLPFRTHEPGSFRCSVYTIVPDTLTSMDSHSKRRTQFLLVLLFFLAILTCGRFMMRNSSFKRDFTSTQSIGSLISSSIPVVSHNGSRHSFNLRTNYRLVDVL
jgi:hypothetical protein